MTRIFATEAEIKENKRLEELEMKLASSSITSQISTALPKCCGEVVNVVLSPSISYDYCRGCKKEVVKSSVTKEESDEFFKELDFLFGQKGSDSSGTPSSSNPPPDYF